MENRKGRKEVMSDSVPLRIELSPEWMWNIARMYKDQDAWEADFVRLESLIAPIEACRDRMDELQAVVAVFEREVELDRLLERLYVFAHLQEDQDTDNSESQALMARIRAKLTEVEGRLAWISPAILAQDMETLEGWAQSEAMTPFRYSMRCLIRRKKHTLSEREETLLSKASDILGASGRTYSMLTNADLRFPEISNEEGRKVEMSDGRYVQFLMSRERRVREEAFAAMYSTYGGFQNTIASTLSTTVKLHNYRADVRHYPSALEAALFGDQIPVDLYNNLIETTRRSLSHYYDYLRLRKRQLGLERLEMYDLYVSIVPEFDLRVPFEQAREWVLEACAPLGAEYCDVLKTAFNDRWIDVYENRGKRSGAYSSGCYDSLPYVLLNYQDTLNDAFTLAHELGHSMHTWLANHTQPPQTAHYPIFIAEIASTLNEELLLRYLLEQADSAAFKAYLLNHSCDSFKGTVYRQTMFAEFEKRIHELDAKGVPLTRESLSGLYAGINADYYGPDVHQDDRIALEWMRIPHFYYNFYVYKYATSFCASQIFTEQVLQSAEGRDRYIGLLKDGGSDDPLTLIKKAGVDLTDADTLHRAFGAFAANCLALEHSLNVAGASRSGM
jgi:oligoendopeptidase F